jgi:hypothetical protein
LHFGGRGLELAIITAGGCLASWVDGPTFSYPHRTGAAVTLADGSILFVGGLNSTDVAATEYSERTTVDGTAVDVIANQGTGLKYASGCLAANGKVYATGEGQTSLYVYDPATDTWTSTAARATAFGKYEVCIPYTNGGHTKIATAGPNGAYNYDVNAGTWALAAGSWDDRDGMGWCYTGLSECLAVAVGGGAGGADGSRVSFFDDTNNMWATAGFYGRSFRDAQVLCLDTICETALGVTLLITGGTSAGTPVSDAGLLDVSADTLSSTGFADTVMPAERTAHRQLKLDTTNALVLAGFALDGTTETKTIWKAVRSSALPMTGTLTFDTTAYPDSTLQHSNAAVAFTNNSVCTLIQTGTKT